MEITGLGGSVLDGNQQPVVKEGENGRYAASEPIGKLIGHDIKAGLFKDPEMRGLSAIVFSNACTIGKFNRMGVLAGLGVLPGVKLRRTGICTTGRLVLSRPSNSTWTSN
jgi:hypothetical protein